MNCCGVGHRFPLLSVCCRNSVRKEAVRWMQSRGVAHPHLPHKWAQGRSTDQEQPVDRNETLLPFCSPLLTHHLCPQLILSCDILGGRLLPHVGCCIFTAEDHVSLIFVGPVAPGISLAHSRCSVNIALCKELGFYRGRQTEQAESRPGCAFSSCMARKLPPLLGFGQLICEIGIYPHLGGHCIQCPAHPT